MYAYCNNNPVMYSDPTGYCATHTYYYIPSCPGCNPDLAKLHEERGADWAMVRRNDNFKPRKDKRHGSEDRQKTGDRERNVKHPNGEEHSRVPKGNGLKRAIAVGGIVVGVVVFAVLVVDDATGGGVADDVVLPVIAKVIWDCGVVVAGG